ncbi:DUF4453 domain-containing protein [Donghicola mangrovi]|uniref:DUF4453 domain-containing protein n=1 Tax=Donghicola mangrovi TaxID=2729614 RepID=A0A850QBH1_9RHOB|nr:DUF4453 domain-containing protein [Donghicola mangrovi]
MIRAGLALCALLAAGPVSANCAEMWFVRNLIFDNAGMCFFSPLGVAMFDNSDCTPDAKIEIGAIDEEIVATIKANEADLGCSVDTDQTELPVPHADLLRAVDQLPAVAKEESACLSFNAPTVPVRSSLGIGAAVISSVTAGDTVYFRYEPFGGWEFVVTERTAGWIPLGTITPESCLDWAG